MKEIDNFRIFEVRKFEKQLSYLEPEKNQGHLIEVPSDYTPKYQSWVFVRILQIVKTEKTKVTLLVEDLTGTREVVYKKKSDNDIPFIETAHYNLLLELDKSNTGKKAIVLIKEYKPVGYNNQIKINEGEDVYGALISDVHIGSIYFMRKQFISLLEYLSRTPSVKYLFIAGDLVDGVGIYPEQEKNLYQKNAYIQYQEVKTLFDKHLTRTDIKVYFSPGNHDFLSLFEPQVLSEEIKKRLPKTWILLDNPEYVTVEKKRILFYHGRSSDNLIGKKTPFLSYTRMDKVYHYMFSQRNLSPTVDGSRLDFKRSTGMIDEIPDIFLTGHVHEWCSVIQNGVLFCNSGCWQYPTEYQNNLGINPVKGITQFINLRNPKGSHYKIDFSKPELKEERYSLRPQNVGYEENDESIIST